MAGNRSIRHSISRHGGIGAGVLAVSGFLLLGMRQSYSVPLAFGLSLAQTILFVCAALWLSTRLVGQRSPARNRLATAAVLLYFLSTLASYGHAMARGLPPEAMLSADRFVFTDVCLLGMFFFVLTVVRTSRALETVLRGLVLGGTLSSVFALAQFFVGIDLAPLFRLPGLKYTDFVLVTNLMREGLSRPQGSAGHPLELSAVLTVLVPLAFGVTLAARSRGAKQWPWALCTTILAAGAITTVSRSAIIGLGVAIVVMAWRWPISRLAIGIGGAVTVVIAGVLAQAAIFTAFVDTFAGSANDPSIASRAIGAAYVATHYREHLWLGQGVGSYSAFGQPVLDNQYLSRLMETGLLGLAALVLALVVPMILALLSSTAKADPVSELASAVAGALAALITISFILDVAGFAQIWYLTWLLLALACTAWRLSRRSRITSTTKIETGELAGSTP